MTPSAFCAPASLYAGVAPHSAHQRVATASRISTGEENHFLTTLFGARCKRRYHTDCPVNLHQHQNCMSEVMSRPRPDGQSPPSPSPTSPLGLAYVPSSNYVSAIPREKASDLTEPLPMDGFHEECGVVGVWNHPDAAAVAYYALHSLQHRGQEGAGMVVCDGSPQLSEHKGLGLISEVFAGDVLSTPSLAGFAAIAHNRYSTAGAKSVRNVQPFVAGFRQGQVSVAHNGNLTNADSLREELELRGSIFSSSSDTETILHLMATSVGSHEGIERKAADALSRVEGAFSVLILTKDTMVAVRDPHGFRPLVMGELATGHRGDTALIFASESCALDIVNAKLVREVEPGEMIVVKQGEPLRTMYPFRSVSRKACVFEHVYFSKPNSVVFGRSVYMSRFRFGELLADSSPVPHADAVIPIPESGVPAALGFASASGVPYQQAIMRSHYVGRTFIAPNQVSRDIGVRLKLAPVRSLIEGRSVVVVDDSIVRGTTSVKIVRMLREAGAREVHMRIACPPIVSSCFYGVDTPNQKELISFKMSDEEVRQHVGADSLAFLPLDAMHNFLGDEAPTFCDACFSSDYPVEPPSSAEVVPVAVQN